MPDNAICPTARATSFAIIVGLFMTLFSVTAAAQKDNYCQSAGAANDFDCRKTQSFQDSPTELDTKLKELNRWLEDEQQSQNDTLVTIENPSSDKLKEQIQFNSSLLATELQRAKKLQLNGDDNGAFNQVNRYLVNNPRDPNGWLLYGITLINKNKLDEAANIFRYLIKLYPDAPEPYNNLAAIYALQGDNEKAIAMLLQAFETHPSYAQVQRNLKAVYAALAKKAYNKALDLDNGQPSARISLGILDQVYHSIPTGPDSFDEETLPELPSLPTTELVIEERQPSEGIVPILQDETL